MRQCLGPCTSPHGHSDGPRAPGDEDVERLLAAARAEPIGRQRMFWPARDAALIRFLDSTGARAEEACGACISELDRRAERPIWRVGRLQRRQNPAWTRVNDGGHGRLELLTFTLVIDHQ